MMQDFPKLLSPQQHKVGFCQFHTWMAFSAVKNSIADGADKQKAGNAPGNVLMMMMIVYCYYYDFFYHYHYRFSLSLSSFSSFSLLFSFFYLSFLFLLSFFYLSFMFLFFFLSFFFYRNGIIGRVGHLQLDPPHTTRKRCSNR